MGALQISNDQGGWTDLGSEPYRGGLFDDVEDEGLQQDRRRFHDGRLNALPLGNGPTTLAQRVRDDRGGDR